MNNSTAGILLLNKPPQKTSFYLVHLLRKLTRVRKIGHTGTLDPLATGVMVMLVGKAYTTQCERLTKQEKVYETTALLGLETDTQDITGNTLNTSLHQPTLQQVQEVLTQFQGEITQVPPLFSAKKIQGQKLYHLARQGKTIDRPPTTHTVTTTLLSYEYPRLRLRIRCTSGTYIRTLCHDIGQQLHTYGTMETLVRTQNGPYTLDQCLSVKEIQTPAFPFIDHFLQ